MLLLKVLNSLLNLSMCIPVSLKLLFHMECYGVHHVLMSYNALSGHRVKRLYSNEYCKRTNQIKGKTVVYYYIHFSKLQGVFCLSCKSYNVQHQIKAIRVESMNWCCKKHKKRVFCLSISIKSNVKWYL